MCVCVRVYVIACVRARVCVCVQAEIMAIDTQMELDRARAKADARHDRRLQRAEANSRKLTPQYVDGDRCACVRVSLLFRSRILPTLR